MFFHDTPKEKEIPVDNVNHEESHEDDEKSKYRVTLTRQRRNEKPYLSRFECFQGLKVNPRLLETLRFLLGHLSGLRFGYLCLGVCRDHAPELFIGSVKNFGE